LKFDIPFTLLANSVYSISVGPAPNAITNWSAQDSLFGILLTGTSATITRFTDPAGIDGAPGVLSACGNPCLGGAVATDQFGNIDQWNFVAFPLRGPYLTFLTYNTPALGSIDGLGLTQNGLQQLQLNNLNDQVGVWQLSGDPSEPTPVPGPIVGAELPGLLMAIAAFVGWCRSRRSPPLPKQSPVISSLPAAFSPRERSVTLRLWIKERFPLMGHPPSGYFGCDLPTGKSALPSKTDIVRSGRHVSNVPKTEVASGEARRVHLGNVLSRQRQPSSPRSITSLHGTGQQ
jgi:hypothetical protein